VAEPEAPAAGEDWQSWMPGLHENASQAHASGREFYVIELLVDRTIANWTNTLAHVG
jgi:hypothetical protein